MKVKVHDLSFDEFDEINSPREAKTDFDRVIDVAMSRRRFIRKHCGFGSSYIFDGH